MSDLCYFCRNKGEKPLKLKDSFTAHPRAKHPDSKLICSPCEWAINSQCWYWNPNKQAWSKLFTRCWSWLESDDRKLPVFTGEREGLSIVEQLPTRADIREWLINPPNPPFTICIAKSGQKHIYPFREVAEDCSKFPILFEEDILWITHQFVESLAFYESLLSLGFSKAEVDSGNYRGDRLMKCFEQWQEIEKEWHPFRHTLMGELISYVARNPNVSIPE